MHLINTHMHVDHIFGDLYVKNKYGLEVTACEDDAFLGERANVNVFIFSMISSILITFVHIRVSLCQKTVHQTNDLYLLL